jgi:ribonuclease E
VPRAQGQAPEQVEAVAEGTVTTTLPATDTGAAAEGEGRRRRRRGGRGGRRDETGAELEAGDTTVDGEGAALAAREAGGDLTPQAGAAADGTETGAGEERGEREGGRRRGRDRLRRERRGDGETVEAAGLADAQSTAPANGEPTARVEAGEELPPEVPATAAATLETTVAAASAPTPTPVAPAVVEPYVLPLAELERIAQDCGLEWVNSDDAKVAAVQAAIAAEPKPAHVPRERKPVVVVDEGPLVLVETRKDLSQLKLPFEQASTGRDATTT